MFLDWKYPLSTQHYERKTFLPKHTYVEREKNVKAKMSAVYKALNSIAKHKAMKSGEENEWEVALG